ncbi:hypothetical protein [Streptomyces sp. NPDC056883]|uniref:hypothetical protein n=1 Tax=Streptomyces sp. NPDC056883 TaxID=3345959 RepID=UPI003680B7A1
MAPVRIAVTGRQRVYAYLLSEVAICVSTSTAWNRPTSAARSAADPCERVTATRSGSVYRVSEEPHQKVAVSVWRAVRTVESAAPYARTSARSAR